MALTTNGRDAMIRQLWWPSLVRQMVLVGLALAMILIGLTLELRPILGLADNVSARAPTDLAPLDRRLAHPGQDLEALLGGLRIERQDRLAAADADGVEHRGAVALVAALHQDLAH